MNTLHDCACGKATDKFERRKCGKSLAELYEPYVSRLRTRGVDMVCELGVSGGGSLHMWREYFGCAVLGVDIQDHCKQYADADKRISIMIAGQDDTRIRDVLIDCGGADLILDDASHLTDLMVKSFWLLWPRVKFGGLYIIEDTLMTHVKDIASEVSSGGWGGMDKCGVPLVNTRRDIDALLERLAYAVDTSDDMRVAGVHIVPHAIIIEKAL